MNLIKSLFAHIIHVVFYILSSLFTFYKHLINMIFEIMIPSTIKLHVFCETSHIRTLILMILHLSLLLTYLLEIKIYFNFICAVFNVHLFICFHKLCFYKSCRSRLTSTTIKNASLFFKRFFIGQFVLSCQFWCAIQGYNLHILVRVCKCSGGW